jgi:hypothetical protein
MRRYSLYLSEYDGNLYSSRKASDPSQNCVEECLMFCHDRLTGESREIQNEKTSIFYQLGVQDSVDDEMQDIQIG